MKSIPVYNSISNNERLRHERTYSFGHVYDLLRYNISRDSTYLHTSSDDILNTTYDLLRSYFTLPFYLFFHKHFMIKCILFIILKRTAEEIPMKTRFSIINKNAFNHKMYVKIL